MNGAGARCSAEGGARTRKPGDRPGAVSDGGNGQDPREPYPEQARSPRSDAGRCVRIRVGSNRARQRLKIFQATRGASALPAAVWQTAAFANSPAMRGPEKRGARGLSLALAALLYALVPSPAPP